MEKTVEERLKSLEDKMVLVEDAIGRLLMAIYALALIIFIGMIGLVWIQAQ